MSQLGRHTKPIVIANIGGFWDPFLKLLEHMKSETFIIDPCSKNSTLCRLAKRERNCWGRCHTNPQRKWLKTTMP